MSTRGCGISQVILQEAEGMGLEGGVAGAGRKSHGGAWWEQEGHGFKALQTVVVVPSQSLGHSTQSWRTAPWGSQATLLLMNLQGLPWPSHKVQSSWVLAPKSSHASWLQLTLPRHPQAHAPAVLSP